MMFLPFEVKYPPYLVARDPELDIADQIQKQLVSKIPSLAGYQAFEIFHLLSKYSTRQKVCAATLNALGTERLITTSKSNIFIK